MAEKSEGGRNVESVERKKENQSELEKLGDAFLFRIAEAFRDKGGNYKNLQSVLNELVQKIIDIAYPQGSRIEPQSGYTSFDVALTIKGMDDLIPLENNDRIFVSNRLKNPLKIQLKFVPGQKNGDKFISWFSQEEHAIAFVELFPGCVEQRSENGTLESLSQEFPARFLLDSLDSHELEVEGNKILLELESLLQNGIKKDDTAICDVLNKLAVRIYELVDCDPSLARVQPAYKDVQKYRLDLGNGTAGQRIFLSDNSPHFEKGIWSLYFPDSADWGLTYRKAFSAFFPNALKEPTSQSCYYSVRISN
jgi:hypothetical protein